MEISNQFKIFSKKIEKCVLYVEVGCSYTDLYDFASDLAIFAIDNMKASQDKLQKEKEALETANKASEQAQEELPQE